MNFKGEKCVACGNEFTADDDIVVCPECGSPHHRSCYTAENKCANESLHAAGQKWQRTSKSLQNKPKDNSFIICPSCHMPNPNGSEQCMQCGTPLPKAVNTEAASDTGEIHDPFSQYANTEFGTLNPYLGFNPEEDMGGATLKEVTQFVGTNTLYYIPIFKRMKDFGSKLSFNISCLIFPWFYFANRKMWLWALLAAVIGVILNLPYSVLVMADGLEGVEGAERMLSVIYENQNLLENLDSIFSPLNFAFKIVCCLFGNWLYYKFALRSIKKLRLQNRNKTLSPQQVMAVGGVKPINIILITIIMGAISLAALYAAFFMLDFLFTFNNLG